MGVLSLLVKLGIDSVAFEMGVKRAQSIGEKFGSSFKNAVTSRLSNAFSVASVTAYANSIIELADNIDDLAEQLNISTDDVQRFQVLASESGVKFESIAAAITRINDARTAAAKGEGPQRDAMLRAGFSIEEITNKSTDGASALVLLGERLNANRSNADMMAAAADLLGLKLTKAAMAAGKIKDLGPISLFKKEDIEAIGKYDDAVKRLDRTLKIAAAPALVQATGPIERRIRIFEAMKDKAGFLPAAMSVAATMPSFLSEMIFGTKPKPSEPVPEPPPSDDQTQFQKIQGLRFSLGGAQDSLARIGGFTGFQSAQDTAIKQAIEQTLQLKQIAKSTEKTAQVISRD